MMLLTFVLCGCNLSGKKDKEPTPPIDPMADATAKRDLYVSLQPQVDGPSGFIDTDKCDSIHWTALRGVGMGKPAELRAAIEESGQVHRRPLQLAECYPDESDSEISREAILYVGLHALVFNDLDMLNSIWDYGKAHAWIMGRGVGSRTVFTPAAQAVLAQAIRALGGGNKPQLNIPIPRPKGLTDFDAFIQVIEVLMEAKSNGGNISSESRDLLEEQATRQPNNVVYAAMAVRWAGGNPEVAISLLNGNPKYPRDRLPTSAEYCDEWLSQRDEGSSGANPCPDENRKHSGGDWLLAYAILTTAF